MKLRRGGLQYIATLRLASVRLGSRDRMDKGMRITSLHEGFHEVILLLPEVLCLLCNAPGTVVRTPYCTSLHVLDDET